MVFSSLRPFVWFAIIFKEQTFCQMVACSHFMLLDIIQGALFCTLRYFSNPNVFFCHFDSSFFQATRKSYAGSWFSVFHVCSLLLLFSPSPADLVPSLWNTCPNLSSHQSFVFPGLTLLLPLSDVSSNPDATLAVFLDLVYQQSPHFISCNSLAF